MRNVYIFNSALIMCAVVFLVSTPIALAATSPTITGDPVKDATVNLYCRLKNGGKTISTSGSGVFISDRGIILTNAHVAQYFLLTETESRVKGTCVVRGGSPAKDLYVARVLYLSPKWITDNAKELRKSEPKGTGERDFALLYVTGAKTKKVNLPKQFPALSLDSFVSESEAVTVSGYPTEGATFSEIKNKLALILASTTIDRIRGFTQGKNDYLTLPGPDGMGTGVSGGPVVDTHNTVSGIITGKSSNKKNPTLRAITLPYVSETIRQDTGTPLSTLLLGDLVARANTTHLLISSDMISALTGGLFRKR